MAQVSEVREIPLDDLQIGMGQVRIRDVGRDIDELAESISKVGLLEPIVVCPAEEQGKYEILTGQRRFLACRQLGWETILAGVITERVDETTAKVLSVTENLVRRDLNTRDLIDVCTSLYRKYGSMRAVVEETGLPMSKVSNYVKYDRLAPELRELVDNGTVDVKVALRAQDAASVTGDFQPEEAVALAKEMAPLSGAQQDRIVKARESDPDRTVEEVVEAAKDRERVRQVVVTLGPELHRALQTYAQQEGTNQDDAAGLLLSEALMSKGFLEEESP